MSIDEYQWVLANQYVIEERLIDSYQLIIVLILIDHDTICVLPRIIMLIPIITMLSARYLWLSWEVFPDGGPRDTLA